MTAITNDARDFVKVLGKSTSLTYHSNIVKANSVEIERHLDQKTPQIAFRYGVFWEFEDGSGIALRIGNSHYTIIDDYETIIAYLG